MILTKHITHTETVKIDVDLPYFTKDADYHWAILSEDETIRVMFREYSTLKPSVAINISSMIGDAIKGEPITQKEFEDFYQKANDYLSAQFEQMREKILDRKNVMGDIDTFNSEDLAA